MQFKSVLAASALVAGALAAPTAVADEYTYTYSYSYSDESGSHATAISGEGPAAIIGALTGATSTSTASLPTFTSTARGTIYCTTELGVCQTHCGDDLQALCTLVGAFDSVFYGLEVLAGFQIDCTEAGCKVNCPTDGTVVCALDNAGAVFDSVFTVGEGIIIDGVEDILNSLLGDASSAALSPSSVSSILPSLSSLL